MNKQGKIRKVMKEFKNGTLKSSDGKKVTSRKQALAIAMSESEDYAEKANIMDSIYIDDTKEAEDIIKAAGTEDLFEKAKHQVGDIHPNGKWVWTEYAPGKFDWKSLKGKYHKKGGNANTGSGSSSINSNKQTDASKTTDKTSQDTSKTAKPTSKNSDKAKTSDNVVYSSKNADAYDKGDGKTKNYPVPTHTSYSAGELYNLLINYHRNFSFKDEMPSKEIMNKLKKDFDAKVKVSYQNKLGRKEIYRIEFMKNSKANDDKNTSDKEVSKGINKIKKLFPEPNAILVYEIYGHNETPKESFTKSVANWLVKMLNNDNYEQEYKFYGNFIKSTSPMVKIGTKSTILPLDAEAWEISATKSDVRNDRKYKDSTSRGWQKGKYQTVSSKVYKHNNNCFIIPTNQQLKDAQKYISYDPKTKKYEIK